MITTESPAGQRVYNQAQKRAIIYIIINADASETVRMHAMQPRALGCDVDAGADVVKGYM